MSFSSKGKFQRYDLGSLELLLTCAIAPAMSHLAEKLKESQDRPSKTYKSAIEACRNEPPQTNNKGLFVFSFPVFPVPHFHSALTVSCRVSKCIILQPFYITMRTGAVFFQSHIFLFRIRPISRVSLLSMLNILWRLAYFVVIVGCSNCTDYDVVDIKYY